MPHLHHHGVILVVLHERVPEGDTRQHPGVAEDYDAVLGAGQRDVEAPRIGEETDALVCGCGRWLVVLDRVG